jgi:hypothetical protein
MRFTALSIFAALAMCSLTCSQKTGTAAPDQRPPPFPDGPSNRIVVVTPPPTPDSVSVGARAKSRLIRGGGDFCEKYLLKQVQLNKAGSSQTVKRENFQLDKSEISAEGQKQISSVTHAETWQGRPAWHPILITGLSRLARSWLNSKVSREILTFSSGPRTITSVSTPRVTAPLSRVTGTVSFSIYLNTR